MLDPYDQKTYNEHDGRLLLPFDFCNPLELLTCDELVALEHATDNSIDGCYSISDMIQRSRGRHIVGIDVDYDFFCGMTPHESVVYTLLCRPETLCEGGCLEVCNKYGRWYE